MSLENGILGFLTMKPLSGYDIKKLFNISAANFWPADQAQIYRSLKNLENNGLIEVNGSAQDEGPSKKLYAITDKGREALRGWLLAPTQSDFTRRSPFLMQLFFSGALSKTELLEFIEAQIEQNNILLQRLRDNYNENRSNYIRNTGIEKGSMYYNTAVYTHRWGMFSCEAYSKFLEDIKGDILADEEE
ncbi:MAG: PadR family transcriptional regulator [Desulfitobacterium sp.]